MIYRYLLLVMLLVIQLAGCNDDCINAGENVNTHTVKADVPVKPSSFGDDSGNHPDSDKASTWWMDSGEDIKNSEIFTIDITGAVNLCQGSGGPTKVKVPYKFCKDGTSPLLNKSQYIQICQIDAHARLSCSHSINNQIMPNFFGKGKDLLVNASNVSKININAAKQVCIHLPDDSSKCLYWINDPEDLETTITSNSIAVDVHSDIFVERMLSSKEKYVLDHVVSKDERKELIDKAYREYLEKAQDKGLYPWDTIIYVKNKDAAQRLISSLSKLYNDKKEDYIGYSGKIVPNNLIHVCQGHGDAYSEKGWYIDSGMTAKLGDSLIFKLVPTDITLSDCNNLPTGVVLDSPGSLGKDSHKKDIDPVYICNHGGTVNVKGASIKVPIRTSGDYPVDVTNDDGVIGNKIATEPGLKWFGGSLVDLRVNTNPLYSLVCPAQGQQPTDELLKYNTYKLNRHCGNIVLSDSDTKGYHSMFYDLENAKIKFGTEDAPQTITLYDIPKKDEDGIARQWADLLVARVGGSEYDDSEVGYMCLPTGAKDAQCLSQYVNNSDPRSYSLRLSYPYRIGTPSLVNKKDPNDSQDMPVMLGIMNKGSYINDVGGYHVSITKQCPRSDGEDLYMLIQEPSTPITVYPGDPGTISLKNRHPEKGYNKFVVNVDNEPKAGRIYFGIKDANHNVTSANAHNYTKDNMYNIAGVRNKHSFRVSSIFTFIDSSILDVLYGPLNDLTGLRSGGAVYNMYNNLISGDLGMIVQVSIILMISLFGCAYILGLIQSPQVDIFMKVAKIGIVLELIHPDSWQFFTSHFLNVFIYGVNFLTQTFSGSFDVDPHFGFLDKTFGMFLANETWLRFSALIFAGIPGWLILFVLLWGIWVFTKTALSSMMMYLMSIVAIALLICLFPLFLCFILFAQTRSLFDSWLKLIFSNSLQIVAIMATLGFMNTLIMNSFYNVTNFTACPACGGAIKLPPPLDGIPAICILTSVLVPQGYNPSETVGDHMKDQHNGIKNYGFLGIPITISSLLIFYIFVSTTEAMVMIMMTCMQSITGTMGGVMLAAVNANQALLGAVGMDNESKSRRERAKKMKSQNKTKMELEAKKSRGGVRGSGQTSDSNADGRGDLDRAAANTSSGAINTGGNNVNVKKGRDASDPNEKEKMSKAQNAAKSAMGGATVPEGMNLTTIKPEKGSVISIKTSGNANIHTNNPDAVRTDDGESIVVHRYGDLSHEQQQRFQKVDDAALRVQEGTSRVVAGDRVGDITVVENNGDGEFTVYGGDTPITIVSEGAVEISSDSPTDVAVVYDSSDVAANAEAESNAGNNNNSTSGEGGAASGAVGGTDGDDAT